MFRLSAARAMELESNQTLPLKNAAFGCNAQDDATAKRVEIPRKLCCLLANMTSDSSKILARRNFDGHRFKNADIGFTEICTPRGTRQTLCKHDTNTV